MEQIMTHNINKELIIYGVYSTMYDMWNGSDVLCSARKRFFETGAAQKKRSSIKINDSTYNYSYTLESGSALKYRRTKGARQAERVIEIPDGYAVEQYDDMRRPVKRVFYSLRHIWLRTEYLNEIDGSVNMMIAAGADAEKQALILKVGSRSEILIPFDVSLDKELTNKLNILTSEPKVFCVTNCGSFYFCSEDEYEARMKALNRLVSEQKAETDTEPVSDEQFDGSDFVIDTDLLEGDGSGFDLRSSEEIRIDEPESDADDNAEEYTEPIPAWLTEANPGSETNPIPVLYSHFLTPAEQGVIAEQNFRNGTVSFVGGYEDAERRLCRLCAEEYCADNGAPVILYHITATARDAVISHRDVLGSLMGLGIKREMIGDILAGSSKPCRQKCSRAM